MSILKWFRKKTPGTQQTNAWAEIAKRSREERAKQEYEKCGAQWLELVPLIEAAALRGQDSLRIDHPNPLFNTFSSDAGVSFLKDRGLTAKTEFGYVAAGMWLMVRWA